MLNTPAVSDAPSHNCLQSSEAEMQAGQEPSAPFSKLFAKVFLDQGRTFSRPKLLFCVAGFDALLMAAGGLLTMQWSETGGLPQADLVVIAIIALASVLLLRWNWSYSISALQDWSGQLSKVGRVVLVLMLSLAGSSYITGVEIVGANHLIWWMSVSLVGLVAIRLVARLMIETLARAGVLSRRTVIVGSGKDADELAGALSKSGNGQVRILGYFDDRGGERASDSTSGIVKLGGFDQLAAFCQNEEVDLVIVSVPLKAEDRLLQILQDLFSIRVDIRISSLNAKLRLNSSAYKYVGDVPVLAVMDKPLNDWDRAVKNFEDRMLAVAILILAAPLMALVAMAVRLDSKGPALFKQRRYGFNNQLIEVYKFRSMFVEQSDATANQLVTKDDLRVTRVGRIIRKTSLDELPQLFNVLTGEMSLVGPRPHATQAKAGSTLYQDVVQGYLARHRVKPGITGWAQICGWRGETDTPDKIQRRVECDLYYIDNWSVRFDLYVMLATPFVLLSGKNAY